MGNSTSTNQGSNTARPSTPHAFEENLNYLAKLRKAENARKEAIATNRHDHRKENQQVLKKLFKRLDPMVSKVETDVRGELQLSVKYDAVNSNLLVYIIKCRDLGMNSVLQKTANPFVTLSIIPDPEGLGVKRTSTSDEPSNPAFHEKFVFPVEEVGLLDTKLILKANDHDVVNDDTECLGEVVISLSDFSFNQSSVHTAWYSLQPETDWTITGSVDVSLSYSLPQTLSVTVLHANNLKINPVTGDCCPVVKVGIPGIDKVFVTQARPGQRDPQWNETFSFDVPQEEFNFRYVVLTVIDDGTEPECLLGHVVIDLDNLNPEVEFRGSFQLSDMSHNDRLRSKWFQTAQAQEFQEALWAHSYFNYPSLIFKNHTGKKVLRLHCPAAGGAKAKLHLTSGIPIM